MAKQWSMDEIDNLLESTQENGVSDLVAELMGDSAEAPQAEPVEEKTLPVPEEEDDFDDDYDYDYDDFDEDEGPDVEGVDDLFGDPVEEPADEPEEEPAPEAKEPVASPTPAPAASHVVNYATQAKAAQENLTDETDYVPGFVDDDVVSDEEPEEGGKGGFMNKLRAFRESFIHVVENAGEEAVKSSWTGNSPHRRPRYSNLWQTPRRPPRVRRRRSTIKVPFSRASTKMRGRPK